MDYISNTPKSARLASDKIYENFLHSKNYINKLLKYTFYFGALMYILLIVLSNSSNYPLTNKVFHFALILWLVPSYILVFCNLMVTFTCAYIYKLQSYNEFFNDFNDSYVPLYNIYNYNDLFEYIFVKIVKH